MTETKGLSNSEKENFAKRLKEKNVKLECPMCGNKDFILVDGYFKFTLQTTIKGTIIGGPSIPAIGVICSNCGFISNHAIGALGLLDIEKEKDTSRGALYYYPGLTAGVP